MRPFYATHSLSPTVLSRGPPNPGREPAVIARGFSFSPNLRDEVDFCRGDSCAFGWVRFDVFFGIADDSG